MPELPEVERVRQELSPRIIGRLVTRVVLHRRDIVRGPKSKPDLLLGARLDSILRQGKQLAIVGSTGRVLCVHLGMTGQFFHLPPGATLPRKDHVHVIWSLTTVAGSPAGRLLFRDPRRFGGLWTFASLDDLKSDRWTNLGPDALRISTRRLSSELNQSARAIKAALLDQRVCAGIGNIYADESLFRAGVNPALPCRSLTPSQWEALTKQIRSTLRDAIKGGGSTLRDYVGGDGSRGGYQAAHLVYGRGGRPCLRCGTKLDRGSLAQRTTVWCPLCQPIPDEQDTKAR